jgi:anti-sigma factor RsiW
MTCDRCQSLIDEYVDGTLAAEERARVEAHLVECAACRATAQDFGAIRRTARDLAPHVPPARVWTKLSAAIDAERERSVFSRLFGQGAGWRPLAVAATLLVIVGGTSWIVMRQLAPAAPASRVTTATPPAASADPELLQSVETELKLAEEHYQKAIAGLEQITRAESAALDPQVAAVLQKNLDVIDHAIGESRAALQTQPTSEVAQESLFEALRSKVSLLQETVGLINEMRKGNPEGTARIVSGLNQ